MPETLVDAVSRIYGMKPNSNRLSILPNYTKSEGLIAPQFVYNMLLAAATPGYASQGNNVSPQQGLDFAMNTMGGAVTKGITSPAAGVGAGMGDLVKGSFPKRTLEQLDNILKQMDYKIGPDADNSAFKAIWAEQTKIKIEANKAANRGKLKPIFQDMNLIPPGTKVLATHGLKYKLPTMGTVVKNQTIQLDDGLYNIPHVDFGDGHPRRLAPYHIQDVYRPRGVE